MKRLAAAALPSLVTEPLLAKVRISGGGRRNVTHAGFDPAQLVQQICERTTPCQIMLILKFW